MMMLWEVVVSGGGDCDCGIFWHIRAILMMLVLVLAGAGAVSCDDDETIRLRQRLRLWLQLPRLMQRVPREFDLLVDPRS